MSKHLRWLGLLVCVGLAACQSPPQPLSGQITVTLRNGQDFSPSGTVVTLLEARVVEGHLRRLHLDLDLERRTFETRHAQLQQDYDRVRQERPGREFFLQGGTKRAYAPARVEEIQRVFF